MYEIYDACTVMFFWRYVNLHPFLPLFHPPHVSHPFPTLTSPLPSHTPPFPGLYIYCSLTPHPRNKHIQVDFGTGNNNKINFSISDKQDLIDIFEVAYKAASKGKGLAVSPKDYSTRMRY